MTRTQRDNVTNWHHGTFRTLEGTQMYSPHWEHCSFFLSFLQYSVQTNCTVHKGENLQMSRMGGVH